MKKGHTEYGQMEVDFPPEQQKVIETLAAQNGTSPPEQVRRMVDDALKRQHDYDRWFREQVREGSVTQPITSPR
jgi:hypothetical protein